MGARLGQHFLANPQIADQIVRAANIALGTEVVEIGPGRGVLSRRLLDCGARLTAVELDANLCETLMRELGGAKRHFESGSEYNDGRLRLIHADFLKLPLSALPSPCVIVSNLPYAVATPILQRILSWNGWTRAVLMFQKEVAERILAGPGSRKYGILSVSVALRARVEPICPAPKAFFAPQPQVDSMVLCLQPLAQSRLPPGLPEDRLMGLVRAAFQHRRKKMAKSISLALHLPQQTVESALEQAGIAPAVRAEEISVDAFIDVARHLREVV